MGYVNMNMDMYTYIYICNIMGVVVATKLRFQVLPPWNCLCFTLYSIVCLEICRFRHVKLCVENRYIDDGVSTCINLL